MKLLSGQEIEQNRGRQIAHHQEQCQTAKQRRKIRLRPPAVFSFLMQHESLQLSMRLMRRKYPAPFYTK